MMTDLPSLNSATSLSDNVALRNYYDKLLFHNNSVKSFADSPMKFKDGGSDSQDREDGCANTDLIGGVSYINHNIESLGGSVIMGLGGHASNGGSSTPQSRSTTTEQAGYWTPTSTCDIRQQSSRGQFFSSGVSFNGSEENSMSLGMMGPVSLSFQTPCTTATQLQSCDNNLSNGTMGAGPYYNMLGQQGSGSLAASLLPVNSASSGVLSRYFPFENNTFESARRSSYISDQLIHGNQQQLPKNQNFDISASFNYPRKHNVFAKDTQFPQSQVQSQVTADTSPSFQRRSEVQGQSQPRSQSLHRCKSTYLQKHSCLPHTNYLSNSVTFGGGLNGSTSKKSCDRQVDTYPLENGLLLLNGRIASSSDLKRLYRNSSGHYFSAKECFEFIDHLKDVLNGDELNAQSSQNDTILKFVDFLKNCNLNYNSQSNAVVSNGQHRRSTGSYLHYKPLVLVALKNGKLELLSLPQSTNLDLAREDLVIIDGDRGKDLAMVIEPKVDIDLALFINFLKKKIHFDSLITAVDQHYPNQHFIQALMNKTNSGSVKNALNHKLYDVIELTQLIIPSKQVLRFATSWEVSTNLHNKFQDELKALHIAHLKLKSLNNGVSTSSSQSTKESRSSGVISHSNSYNDKDSSTNNTSGHTLNKPSLNIKILNAEFQFDRKKLTFYYVCRERNDFRELIKELFKFYKTRIWLCAIPNNLGIDRKYYHDRKEWTMYQEMLSHYPNEELVDSNIQTGFIVSPPLYEIELDNFQLGVYKELVNNMFR